MRVLVFGVSDQQGTSKKTRTSYRMTRCYVAQQITSRKTEDYNRIGYGFEAAEVDLDPAALPQFAGVQFPSVLDLDTDMRLQSGRMLPVVTGIKAKPERSQ